MYIQCTALTDYVIKHLNTAMRNTHSHLFHIHTLSLFTENLKDLAQLLLSHSSLVWLANMYRNDYNRTG